MALSLNEIARLLKNLQTQENVPADSEKTESQAPKRRRLCRDDGSQHWVSHDPNKPLQEKLPSPPEDQAAPTGETNFFDILETLIRAAGVQSEERSKALSQSQEELAIANKRIADLTKQLDYAREECDSHYAKLNLTSKDYEKCWNRSHQDKLEWEAQEKDLKREKSQLSSALEEAKDEIARYFMDGFQGAIEQASILFPNTDFSALDPLKIVVDGKIVSE
ncbi:hypothetical protein DEO72_LG11g2781 [Vigna unguiculata]|uniref:Uncharacterized protein n=1 Tax=Vigna unguiculata TaxID=3917 RepID=A0A4D6NTC2_VIGUN|nr:hypothetical protein DEO72_LG11g2780 [Vigna unguiculata]QCE15769.1 hypothetical protein DEO72_LG11g2781 [Vigna unguiculata]